MTALKLIQNDSQQTSNKTTVKNDGENNVELVCETIEDNEVIQLNPESNLPANYKQLNAEASHTK